MITTTMTQNEFATILAELRQQLATEPASEVRVKELYGHIKDFDDRELRELLAELKAKEYRKASGWILALEYANQSAQIRFGKPQQTGAAIFAVITGLVAASYHLTSLGKALTNINLAPAGQSLQLFSAKMLALITASYACAVLPWCAAKVSKKLSYLLIALLPACFLLAFYYSFYWPPSGPVVIVSLLFSRFSTGTETVVQLAILPIIASNTWIGLWLPLKRNFENIAAVSVLAFLSNYLTLTLFLASVKSSSPALPNANLWLLGITSCLLLPWLLEGAYWGVRKFCWKIFPAEIVTPILMRYLLGKFQSGRMRKFLLSTGGIYAEIYPHSAELHNAIWGGNA